ncbi:hypothetical protein LINPERHAP2_LOCUS30109 [Linum perenne]
MLEGGRSIGAQLTNWQISKEKVDLDSGVSVSSTWHS